ncbi:MAG: hypothetical protein AAB354_13135 [candidate division KSB1 bacterium]
MKIIKYILAALLLVGMSGCLFPEKIETRVRFTAKNSKTGQAEQPRVTLTYYNFSSDAQNETDLQKDFEELLKSGKVQNGDEEVEEGMIIQTRNVYLENGKINMRAEAVPEGGKLADVLANGERILVIEGGEEISRIETNGKVLRTDKNYILVWPESLEEIYWVQHFTPEKEEDRAALERNRPTLVGMWEEHLKQR